MPRVLICDGFAGEAEFTRSSADQVGLFFSPWPCLEEPSSCSGCVGVWMRAPVTRCLEEPRHFGASAGFETPAPRPHLSPGRMDNRCRRLGAGQQFDDAAKKSNEGQVFGLVAAMLHPMSVPGCESQLCLPSPFSLLQTEWPQFWLQ